MTHKRLAANAIAEGADLDQANYVSEYRCDGCGQVYPAADLYRIQGNVFRYGGSSGYINGDLCQTCLDTRPVHLIIGGMS
jgi:hypothetical protein